MILPEVPENMPPISLPNNSNLTTSTMMGLTSVTGKVICLLTMALITLIFCLIPIKLMNRAQCIQDIRSKKKWRTIVSYSSCFSGGVFVAACMLDLLPEVEEVVENLVQKISEEYGVDLSNYPLAHFLVVCGFFLILFIEQIVFHIQEKWITDAEHEREPLLMSKEDPIGSYHSLHVHREHFNHHHHQGDSHSDHDEDHHDHIALFKQSNLRAVMLLLALSFHSVFEGVAIGLQDTNSQFVSLFLAVMLHKAVIAFSLGLNIAQSDLSARTTLTCMLLFSLASPLGVGVGLGLAGLPPSLGQEMVSAVLQGVAGGTFIYITFFEVLPHELNVPNNRLWKVFFVFTGYVAVCGVLFLAP